ncbi:MAG: hypothetical protein SRB1_03061 [Desulfobacteraceae bacterium Eth-SRB1]|nr:MAG: hypothetical protein SRB1_03061 [Desulfobacteraceae bacterium Eth-SRB1]
MKIKTRLRIAIILTLIISVVISLFIFGAYREMSECGRKAITTGRVTRNMAELRIVTGEYLLYPGERSLIQWETSRDSLTKLLAEEANIFEDSGGKDALKKTLKSLERFSDIFAELVAIPGEKREYGGHQKNGLSNLKVKLTGDLLVESQSMVSRVFLVNQAIQAKLVSIQRKTGLFTIILFIVFAGFVSAISLWISRSIGAPVTRLEKGIRIIGAGNLDHRVGTDAKDEIGHLSRAFDGMMEDLKKSTVSIDNLNREIDAHKKTEAALRESEEKYRALINGMSDTAWVIDFNANFIDVNDAAVEVLGYSMEELLSMGPQDIDTSVNAGEIKGLIEQMPTDKMQVFETTHSTKDGKTIPVEVKYSFVTYHGKQVILSIARDITNRKQAEEEVKSHREHLALINQILRHDLTNDLVIIQSAINLYNKSPEAQFLKEISSHSGKCIELINRMGELESFMSRHRKLKPYKINDVIDETIKNYPSTGFKVKGRVEVMADDSLASVIDNIVGNAVIHGKADRITITTDKKGAMCEVRIADNGTGIPDEIKKKIFEEGFMYGDTGHTGLGLHIVKKAMENYGGYAYVEDNKPKGAVIALRFRMVK